MKAGTRSFYEQAVQQTIDDIVANLDEALDLEALAARVFLSPFHFHRMFRGMVGETPLELVRRLRIEESSATGAGQRPADHADRLRRWLRDARVVHPRVPRLLSHSAVRLQAETARSNRNPRAVRAAFRRRRHAAIYSPRFRRPDDGCRHQGNAGAAHRDGEARRALQPDPSGLRPPASGCRPGRTVRQARRDDGRHLLRRPGEHQSRSASFGRRAWSCRRTRPCRPASTSSGCPPDAMPRRPTSGRTDARRYLGALLRRVASRQRPSHRARRELRIYRNDPTKVPKDELRTDLHLDRWMTDVNHRITKTQGTHGVFLDSIQTGLCAFSVFLCLGG